MVSVFKHLGVHISNDFMRVDTASIIKMAHQPLFSKDFEAGWSPHSSSSSISMRCGGAYTQLFYHCLLRELYCC